MDPKYHSLQGITDRKCIDMPLTFTLFQRKKYVAGGRAETADVPNK